MTDGPAADARTGARAAADPPRTARLAVIAYFALSGLVFGSWAARIPAVQDELDLSESRLGLALLGIAVGSILAMPNAGWLIGRFGSRRVTAVTATLVCVVLPLLPLAPSGLLLGFTLALFGAAYGLLDVAMNAQAAAVEARYGRPIMSSFHGVFSAGGLVGAAMAAAVAGLDVAPEPHLLAVAVVLLGLALAARPALLPASTDRTDDGPAFARPTRALAGLCLVAFCVLLSEGAIADWSAVLLSTDLGAGAGLAAAGFAAFSLTMAAGRFAGDRLAELLGPAGLLRVGGALVAVGLGGALLLGTPWAALVGFALTGAGLAGTFPVLLSAAGRSTDLPAGTAISAVATAGYAGFLVGPPTIGFVAEAAGLRVGLGVVVLLGVAVVLLAGEVRAGSGMPAATPVCAQAVQDLP